MKNLYKLRHVGLLSLLLILFSCTEDPISSTVTFYPDMTLNGDRITVLTQGDTYTEQGIISTENGVDLEVTTTGSEDVDPNTPGVYDVYYSSINSDGFSKELRRTVIVLSAQPSAVDLSGTFFRNGFANNITRVSDRVYTSDNAGGVSRTDAANVNNLINFTFYNIDDVQIYAPYQEDTTPTGIDVESNIGTIVSPNNFTWVLYASAFYGTAVRNFVR